jgi:exonuclease III
MLVVQAPVAIPSIRKIAQVSWFVVTRVSLIAESLSFFNWNVRGLNAHARREAVKIMLQSHKPKMVCLQGTKLASIHRQTTLEILGQALNGYHYLPTGGTRGRILLGWNSDVVDTSNLVLKDFSLSATVKLKTYGSSFLLTTVYGPFDEGEKTRFLEELSSLKPVVVLGDFNLIYEAKDKSNLNLNRRLMGQFRHALDSCDLFDYALQNRRFTWSNERENPTLVRLDRVFCNKEWDMMFSDFMLQALSSSLSDHCSLFLG